MTVIAFPTATVTLDVLYHLYASRLAVRAAGRLAIDGLLDDVDDVTQEIWARVAARPWIRTWDELGLLVDLIALEVRAQHGIEVPVAIALSATRVVERPLPSILEIETADGPVLIAA